MNYTCGNNPVEIHGFEVVLEMHSNQSLLCLKMIDFLCKNEFLAYLSMIPDAG